MGTSTTATRSKAKTAPAVNGGAGDFGFSILDFGLWSYRSGSHLARQRPIENRESKIENSGGAAS